MEGRDEVIAGCITHQDRRGNSLQATVRNTDSWCAVPPCEEIPIQSWPVCIISSNSMLTSQSDIRNQSAAADIHAGSIRVKEGNETELEKIHGCKHV